MVDFDAHIFEADKVRQIATKSREAASSRFIGLRDREKGDFAAETLCFVTLARNNCFSTVSLPFCFFCKRDLSNLGQQ